MDMTDKHVTGLVMFFSLVFFPFAICWRAMKSAICTEFFFFKMFAKPGTFLKKKHSNGNVAAATTQLLLLLYFNG